MGNVPFAERISARLFTLRQRSPAALRVTPLRFRVAPFTADEVSAWTELPDSDQVGKDVERPVGMVAIDRAAALEALDEDPDARLGILRAIGRQAVVFAPMPLHHLADVRDRSAYTPDYQFGVSLGKQVIRISPVLWLPSGSLRPFEPLGTPHVMSQSAISEKVPVY
jgi:hypothetical protein